MFFSWRIEDPNLSTFNPTQKKQIKTFRKFVMRKPDGFCCVCMNVLYPEDQRYRQIIDVANLPCLDWKLQPLTKPDNEEMKMVCKRHLKIDESKFYKMKYPGMVNGAIFFFVNAVN